MSSLDHAVCITATLWWSMLEAGLSLIAASLPTLSYLITHKSLQSAIRSVRNTISLHSTQRSEDTTAFGGKEESPYTEIGANTSTASHAKISKSDDHDPYELNDLTPGIHVKHEVAMTDNIV